MKLYVNVVPGTDASRAWTLIDGYLRASGGERKLGQAPRNGRERKILAALKKLNKCKDRKKKEDDSDMKDAESEWPADFSVLSDQWMLLALTCTALRASWVVPCSVGDLCHHMKMVLGYVVCAALVLALSSRSFIGPAWCRVSQGVD